MFSFVLQVIRTKYYIGSTAIAMAAAVITIYFIGDVEVPVWIQICLLVFLLFVNYPMAHWSHAKEVRAKLQSSPKETLPCHEKLLLASGRKTFNGDLTR